MSGKARQGNVFTADSSGGAVPAIARTIASDAVRRYSGAVRVS